MRLSGIVSLLFIFCCAVASAEQPPELVFQTGHSGAINTVAISPDGQWLVSGGQDTTLKIWSLRSGNLLRTLYGHNGKISSVAISPDGRFVASAADDGTARLWEVAGGEQVRDLTGHRNMISSVAFASSGSVLTGSTDVIKVWESSTGRQLRSIAIPEKDQAGRLTLSQDGKVFTIGGAVNQPKTGFLTGFTGGGDIYRPLKVIDISSGRELMSYKTDVHAPYATYVLSPDSRSFAIRSSKVKGSSVQESIRVFDVQSGREIAELKVPGAGNAHAMSPLAISANGRWLAAQGEFSSSMKMPVYVYDVASKNLLREFATSSIFIPSTGIDAVTFVSSPFAFSPDAKVLALGGSNSIQLWEPATGQELRSLQTHMKVGATTDPAMDAQWNESLKAQGFSGEDMATMGQATAGIMDSMMDEDGPLGQALRMVGNVPGIKGMMGRVMREKSIEFSPDAKWLVSETPNHVRTWDLASGSLHQERLPLLPPVAFSSDARLYAATEMDYEELKKGKQVSFLVIREMETKTEISRTKWVDDAPAELLFGPDHTWIAAHIGNEVRILDTKTLATQRSFPIGSSSGDVSIFNKSGRYFAIGGKPVSATSSVAGSSDTGLPGFDPKMMEQMAKMMGKQMDRKQMEKMQKEMEKMMGTQKPATLSGSSVDDMLKPSDYSIRIFDLQTGKQVQALGVESVVHDLEKDGPATMPFGGGGSADLHRMQFSKDGTYLAVEDLDQRYPSVKIYESATGRRISTIPVSRKKAESVTGANMFTQKVTRPSFEFHPNGTTIAVSAQEGGYAVNLWDVGTGKQIKQFPHLNRVDALTFHPNGKFLVTRLRDGSLNTWDLSSGALLATMMEFPGLYFTTEWLVATPDGLFDGSPAAWSQIMWRFSRSIYDLAPVETFFNDFYYPGLLTDVFGSNRPQAPRNLSQLDRRQAVVKLKSNAGGDSRTAAVQIEVEEAPADAEHIKGSGVRDVRLFRNGTLVKVWRGDVLQGQSARTLEATVTLTAGENRFIAYAFNQDNVKSADATFKIKGAENLSRKGNAYIVTIGVNEYENPNFNLKYAVADAQAFGENVQRSQTTLGIFEKVQVIPLLDRDATKDKIVSTLKAFAPGGSMVAAPEDALIIYYAGHGTADKSHFYMVPHDLGYSGARDQMDEAAFQTIVKRGISDDELEQILETIIAGQTLLVIDACNSGQALESQERRRGPMNAKGLAQLAYEKGMYILAAAQGYQAALEAAKLGHGYLTYALVEEGMKAKSADYLPQDGTVMVREWLNYASRRVPEMQSEKMHEARLLKHEIAFVEGEEKLQEVKQRSVQQPRVFYRREMETNPLIILKQ